MLEINTRTLCDKRQAEFLNAEADGTYSYHFILLGYSAATYTSDFLSAGTKVNLEGVGGREGYTSNIQRGMRLNPVLRSTIYDTK